MGFWSGRRVLVTGHTGFKGAWLCELLLGRGADLFGLALPPEGERPLFDRLSLGTRMAGCHIDIRDADGLARAVREFAPEIVLHLAAQALVRRSYRNPVATWSSNVMGTVHLLDALARLDRPVTAVIVTTDKVYENAGRGQAFREDDPLGGHDPYSASKAACELVTASWRRCFCGDGVRIATARAGNVIGGGDRAEDRLVPDMIRALEAGDPVRLRNPGAVRPWQHVLDPLSGYLMLAQRLHSSPHGSVAGAYNFGPNPEDTRTVSDLAEALLGHWPSRWTDASDPDAPHEAGHLALAIDKAAQELGWHPRWRFREAVRHTADWYRDVGRGADAGQVTRAQIDAFGAAA